MTELLEKAIAEVSKLPEIKQDKVACWLLEELALDKQMGEPEETLAEMIAKARAEHARGETKVMSKACVIANDLRFPRPISPFTCRRSSAGVSRVPILA